MLPGLYTSAVNHRFVQETLGHADIKLTLGTYSHFLPSMGDQVANAMESVLTAAFVKVEPTR